jgi:hypothetical protein
MATPQCPPLSSERDRISRELDARSLTHALWLAQWSAQRLGWLDISAGIEHLWTESDGRQREMEEA